MTDKEILQGIDKLEDGIPFDEIRNGDKWLDIHELFSEIRERIKWHYPSKGEYPTEKVLVLMKIPGCYVLGWYDDGNWFKDSDETLLLQRFVSRWRYIVPPKEEA